MCDVKKYEKIYFNEGITFNQETTLCRKSIINNITKARVARRMKQGGHGIAERDIERRYMETSDNLKAVLSE